MAIRKRACVGDATFGDSVKGEIVVRDMFRRGIGRKSNMHHVISPFPN